MCKRYPELKIAIKAKTSLPVKENMHQYYRRYTTSVLRQLKQRQRERQKKQWPQINNTLATLHVHHAFLVHFFAVWLHDHHVILLKLGSLTDGDGNENGKKAIGLISKTTTLHLHHAFLYISLPLLPDCNVKVLKFTFCRGREHKTTTFFFFSWTLIQSFKIQLQEHFGQHLTKQTRWNKSDKVWNSANSLFNWRFRSRRLRGCLCFLTDFCGGRGYKARGTRQRPSISFLNLDTVL